MPRSPLSPSKLKYSTGYDKVYHNGTYQKSFLFFEHPIKMINRDHMTMKLANNIETIEKSFFLTKDKFIIIASYQKPILFMLAISRNHDCKNIYRQTTYRKGLIPHSICFVFIELSSFFPTDSKKISCWWCQPTPNTCWIEFLPSLISFERQFFKCK